MANEKNQNIKNRQGKEKSICFPNGKLVAIKSLIDKDLLADRYYRASINIFHEAENVMKYVRTSENEKVLTQIKKGEIIVMDYGFGIGQEMHGSHLSIVLKDSMQDEPFVIVCPLDIVDQNKITFKGIVNYNRLTAMQRFCRAKVTVYPGEVGTTYLANYYCFYNLDKARIRMDSRLSNGRFCSDSELKHVTVPTVNALIQLHFDFIKGTNRGTSLYRISN